MVRNELKKYMRILKINKYLKLVRVSQILASLKQNKKTDGEKRSLFQLILHLNGISSVCHPTMPKK